MTDQPTTTAVARIEDSPLGVMHVSPHAAAQAVAQQVQVIQHVMREVMQEGQHYGTIPGCGDKPTLLQPGAQKLCLAFNLAPSYDVTTRDMPGGHREYTVRCILTHRGSGGKVGEGLGVASTMESKYRFRVAPKKVTDREVPREYWDARKADPKKAQALLGGPGYGTKKDDNGVWRITEGSNEKVEHDNPADYYNTVAKMAAKRAHVHASLNVTGATDMFTQDIEEDPELFGGTSLAPTAKVPGPDFAAAVSKVAKASKPAAPQPELTQHAVSRDAEAEEAVAATEQGLRVTEVKEKKRGKNKQNREWVIYSVAFSDGVTADAFDGPLVDFANDAMGTGAVVVREVEQTQYGHNLKNLQYESTSNVPANGGAAPEETEEQITLSVLSIELHPQSKPNMPVYRVETSEGRFGVVGDAIKSALEPHVGTGTALVCHYVTSPKGRRITRLDDEVAF